jgi:murein DD-endopeptidase MepM/ murein hydrolase activator NlpD
VTDQSPHRSTGRTAARRKSHTQLGWVAHGLAALIIAVLGLALAGSIAWATGAQFTSAARPQLVELDSEADSETGRTTAQLSGRPQEGSSELDNPSLEAYDRREDEIDEASRETVRVAIVEERAAQRSENLSRAAEQIAHAALVKGSNARKQQLAAADRARRVAALKIAQERTRRAIRARVTAEVQRELARERARQLARERAREAARNSGSNSRANSNGDNRNDSGNRSQQDSSSAGNSSSSGGSSGGGARSPVPGAVVGASYGATGAWARYHTGLDFRAGFGTPVRAVVSGVVVYAGNKGNWAGNHVAVRHSGGYTSMSSHLQSISVSDGQSVHAGQVIGHVGSTGRSFGAHLHFEIYPPGVQPGDVYSAVNPIPWLRARGISTS